MRAAVSDQQRADPDPPPLEVAVEGQAPGVDRESEATGDGAVGIARRELTPKIALGVTTGAAIKVSSGAQILKRKTIMFSYLLASP